MLGERFTFDVGFQKQVLHLMFTDEAFLHKCKIHLKGKYFDNDHLAYFFEKAVKFHSKFNTLPDIYYFLNEIKKFEVEKQDLYFRVLKNIYESPPKVIDYIKEELKEFVKENQVIELLKEGTELFRENPKKSFKFIQEQVTEISKIGFSKDRILRLSDLEELILETNTGSFVLPIGIPALDMAINGGLRAGDLLTMIAEPGKGKSVFLVNFGVLALLRGGRVLHINLEGKKDLVIKRYISRLTGIPYSDFYNAALNNDQKMIIKAVQQKLNSQLSVINMVDFKVTIEEVYQFCKERMCEEPYDLLILDYGDLLKTQSTKMELRHAQTEVFRGLARMAGEFQIPAITATQSVRPEKNIKNEERWLGMESASECYEKARVSSIIITINREDKEVRENRLRLNLVKNREGNSNIRVGCFSDYGRMIPYDVGLGFFEPGQPILEVTNNESSLQTK